MKSLNDIANDINKYVEQASRLERTCLHLDLNLVASPLYNFRDALSHYIRLYEATVPAEQIGQAASIDEHLSRGIKDACVSIIDEMKNRILDALRTVNVKFKEAIFRTELHKYKGLELETRKHTKMMLIDSLSLSVDKLIASIKETEDTFNNNGVSFKIKPGQKLP